MSLVFNKLAEIVTPPQLRSFLVPSFFSEPALWRSCVSSLRRHFTFNTPKGWQMLIYLLQKVNGLTSWCGEVNWRFWHCVEYWGRLLRAFNIEFNWFKLSSWINITEQWPYRLSWIILEVEDNADIEDTQPLKAVYERLISTASHLNLNCILNGIVITFISSSSSPSSSFIVPRTLSMSWQTS